MWVGFAEGLALMDATSEAVGAGVEVATTDSDQLRVVDGAALRCAEADNTALADQQRDAVLSSEGVANVLLLIIAAADIERHAERDGLVTLPRGDIDAEETTKLLRGDADGDKDAEALIE